MLETSFQNYFLPFLSFAKSLERDFVGEFPTINPWKQRVQYNTVLYVLFAFIFFRAFIQAVVFAN